MEGNTASFVMETPISGYNCGEKKSFVFLVHKGNDDYNLGGEFVRYFSFYCLSGNITGKSRDIF